MFITLVNLFYHLVIVIIYQCLIRLHPGLNGKGLRPNIRIPQALQSHHQQMPVVRTWVPYYSNLWPKLCRQLKTPSNHAPQGTSIRQRLQPLPLEPNAAVQPPTLLDEITDGSHVQNTTKGNQDCLVASYPPQALSALSLTMRVDQKTRAQIQSDEYVKFALLCKQNNPDGKDSYKTVEKDGQLIFQKTSDKTQITFIYKWIESFHVLVAIDACSWDSKNSYTKKPWRRDSSLD